MKVLYDHQAFSIQDYGGISRYFIELFHHLPKTDSVSLLHTPQFSNNVYLNEYDGVPFTSFLRHRKFERKMMLMRHVNNISTYASLALQEFDLFHPTYYEPYFLRSGLKKPFVITFHDMIHERFKKQYPVLDTPLIAHKELLLQKCAKVLAVSENTKQDIIELYQIPKEKIAVVHLASSLERNIAFSPPVKTYLLYVGNRTFYKNFLFMAEAIAPILLKHPDLHLVCAGGGEFTREETAVLQQLQVSKQVLYAQINDSTLAGLYTHAQAFIFPSLYEGFGIPTIEAMSCGCPVIASNRSSIPEVGGNAALYFDPTDRDAITHAVEKVLFNTDLQQELRNKGYERAKFFSWQKTASQTLQVYQEVV